MVDYETARFVLGRLATLKRVSDEIRNDLVGVVLRNMEHLYPVADSIHRFLLSFTGIGRGRRARIARALLRPIQRRTPFAPPEFYVMWVLAVFAESPEWGEAEAVVGIYRNSDNEVVKRYAATALAEVGSRSHVLGLKEDYDRASPLLRLAILLALRKLGTDERKFWRRRAVVSGAIEKLID